MTMTLTRARLASTKTTSSMVDLEGQEMAAVGMAMVELAVVNLAVMVELAVVNLAVMVEMAVVNLAVVEMGERHAEASSITPQRQQAAAKMLRE